MAALDGMKFQQKISKSHVVHCWNRYAIYSTYHCSLGCFLMNLNLLRLFLYIKQVMLRSSHYRPVSVLPVFSKVLERLMYNRLLAHINANNLLYKFQFGFRNKHSPNLAMIYLIDKISNALQNGDLVLGLFLDFSKAFDTVDHDILLDKLEFYGIRGCAHDWFKSYLTNRKQFVEFDSHTSSLLSITCGVPRGSLCFLLMTLTFLYQETTLINLSLAWMKRWLK